MSRSDAERTAIYNQRRLEGLLGKRKMVAADPVKRAKLERQIAATKAVVDEWEAGAEERAADVRAWEAKWAPVVAAPARSASHRREVLNADITPDVAEDRRAAWAGNPVGCLGRAFALVGCAIRAEETGAKVRDVVFLYDHPEDP